MMIRKRPVEKFYGPQHRTDAMSKLRPRVAVLRAVTSFARHLARLKNAMAAFFKRQFNEDSLDEPLS
jgi:hypothetical protein